MKEHMKKSEWILLYFLCLFLFFVWIANMPNSPSKNNQIKTNANSSKNNTAARNASPADKNEINFGYGADPNTLSPDQREKWKKIKDAMLLKAHAVANLANEYGTLHFISAFGMEDGWECWDFVLHTYSGDRGEAMIAVSPNDKTYLHAKASGAHPFTYGSLRAWNSHCAGKKPFVDATNLIDFKDLPKETQNGIGVDPENLPFDFQKKTWNDLRNIMLSEAHQIVNSSVNPSSMHFISAFLMDDGWQCWDVVGKGVNDDMIEMMIAVSPESGIYIRSKSTDYTKKIDRSTSGFFRAWNSHCVGKKPLVDVTDSLNR